MACPLSPQAPSSGRRRAVSAGITTLALAVLGLTAGSATALAVGSISGTVGAYPGSDPIGGVEVCASSVSEEEFRCAPPTGSGGPSAGEYTISGLPSGSYKVEFWSPSSLNYVSQYFDAKSSWQQADEVEVADGVDTPNVDAALEEGGWIEGRVIDPITKAGIAGVFVCASPIDESGFPGCAVTNLAGDYEILGLAGDSYEVVFLPDEEDATGYAAEYYDGVASWLEATPVSVSVGSGVNGVDAELEKVGQIAGTVTDSSSGAAIGLAIVCARDAFDAEIYGCAYTSRSGQYAIRGLPVGSYKAWFSPDVPAWEEEDDYLQQYYSAKPTFGTANPVSLAGGGVVAGIDAQLISRKAKPATLLTVPPVAAPPVKLKPKLKRHCRKGQRKVRARGKVRCVRIHRKRHRSHRSAGRERLYRTVGDYPLVPYRP